MGGGDSIFTPLGDTTIEAADDARALSHELQRPFAGFFQLTGVQSPQYPADRRTCIGSLLRIDRARDDQAVDGPRHRHVVEPQPLGLLLGALRLAHGLVLERTAALARSGIRYTKAEPAIREAQDLV